SRQKPQIAPGMIGQPPTDDAQEMQLTVSLLGRLREVEQFENIILRSSEDGRMLRLKDVARVEPGSKTQDVGTKLDGKPTVFLAIFQAPDANALETHDLIIAKMEELKRDFPEDVDYDIGFTTVPYTRETIREVFHSLRAAVLLV